MLLCRHQGSGIRGPRNWFRKAPSCRGSTIAWASPRLLTEALFLDTLTKSRRSWNMSRIRSVRTGPEMVVRRLVYRIRRGYRLNRSDLPGKPDIAFLGARKAIFVHGCFWHGHTHCRRAARPKSNTSYWGPKIEGNRRRDIRNSEALNAAGWDILVVWECELADPDAIVRRLRQFLARKQMI